MVIRSMPVHLFGAHPIFLSDEYEDESKNTTQNFAASRYLGNDLRKKRQPENLTPYHIQYN
nr:hypothetical protein [Mucilaginibacter sp. FT3.2]